MNVREPPHGDAWVRGLTLYAAGKHWHAHEAWEQLWLGEQDAGERAFLRAVIQVAAAMVKAEQGNLEGVRKNLGKALANLDGLPARCRGVDTRVLATECERCARHARTMQAAAGGWFDWRFKPALPAGTGANP